MTPRNAIIGWIEGTTFDTLPMSVEPPVRGVRAAAVRPRLAISSSQIVASTRC